MEEVKNKSPANFIDMTGWKMCEHGVPESRLTVIERVVSTTKYRARWLVKCSCIAQTIFEVDGKSIRNGNTLSCGCLQKEKAQKAGKSNKEYNQFRFDGEIVIGLTSNTNREFYVDRKNFDQIKEYCWYEKNNTGMSRLLAKDPKTGKTISMHGLLGYKNYDHIDRNELNNLESNLREATPSQNAMNRSIREDNKSGVTGVSYDKWRNKWYGYLDIGGKRVLAQYFDNKYDAIRARLKAEKEYFKEFSAQQHLYEQYNV